MLLEQKWTDGQMGAWMDDGQMEEGWMEDDESRGGWWMNWWLSEWMEGVR